MSVKARIRTTIIIGLIVASIRKVYYKKTKDVFKKALTTFTFDLFDFDVSILIIFFISIGIPVLLMFIAFADIKIRSPEKSYKLGAALSKHLFCCYLAVCSVYCIDLIQDYYNLDLEVKKSENYNSWHKYILHAILSPILFLDAVYSIEIEKIKIFRRDLSYGKVVYFSIQFIIAFYLIYILLVLLYIDNQLGKIFLSLISLKNFGNATLISGYLMDLAKDSMICVFIPLFFGLFDHLKDISKFGIFFKVYVDWMYIHSSKNLEKAKQKLLTLKIERKYLDPFIKKNDMKNEKLQEIDQNTNTDVVSNNKIDLKNESGIIRRNYKDT